MKKILCLVLLLPAITKAQQKEIQLYKGPAPGSESWNWEEKRNSRNAINLMTVYNVVHPTLSVFSPEPSIANGTSVIVCPGGGFHFLSIDSEGNDVANWLIKKGVTVFVLKYRTAHILTDDPFGDMMNASRKKEWDAENEAIIPLSIADGKTAITYVRTHAAGYGLLPDCIGIIGFSAGGKVTASSAFNYTAANCPDFVAPIYPYMPLALQSEILTDAPPMFLVCASDDQLGLAPHSVDLYSKWLAAKRPAELHMYAKGGHGFGMNKQNIPTDRWIERFSEWLDLLGYMKPKK